jgi:hypothetical protein
MIQPCRRFLALDHIQRGLVIEAAGLMLIGWTGLRVFRFATVRRALDRVVVLTSERQASAGEDVVPLVRRAVTAVASRCPPATCLVQALAAHAMLRRRHVSCKLRFGVRFNEKSSDPLEGHAWVECHSSTIDAGDGRSAFSVLSP